ncbi:hypothetical protein NZK35_20765, partial [Stieleria sp. ICT_E10.1]|uniref:hypothetical protein n=1 Tax=Stieleria sedimenti TaxID=2976331 RepID=UPI00217FE26D
GVSHRNGKTSITEAWKAGTIGLMNRGYCQKLGNCVGPLDLRDSLQSSPVAHATGIHSAGPPGLKDVAYPVKFGT